MRLSWTILSQSNGIYLSHISLVLHSKSESEAESGIAGCCHSRNYKCLMTIHYLLDILHELRPELYDTTKCMSFNHL